MKLKIKQSSEEVETWFFNFLTVSNSLVKEEFSLQYFIKLDLLINIKTLKWISVAFNYWYDLQAVGVFPGWEKFPGLVKVFSSHKVVFVIHLKDAFT